MKIKRSTFKKILIIVLLLNIILGISIYSEVKQISSEEQIKYYLIFLVIIAIFFLGYLIGNYKGYMEGWHSLTKINRLTREMRKVRERRKDTKPKPNPKLISYAGSHSTPKRKKNRRKSE